MKKIYVPIYISPSGARRQSPIARLTREDAETLAADVVKNSAEPLAYEVREIWICDGRK